MMTKPSTPSVSAPLPDLGSLEHSSMGPLTFAWTEAYDATKGLNAIFKSIADLAKDLLSGDELAGRGLAIRRVERMQLLAESGAYIATDKGNYYDCQQEEARNWEKANAKA